MNRVFSDVCGLATLLRCTILLNVNGSRQWVSKGTLGIHSGSRTSEGSSVQCNHSVIPDVLAA